MAKRKKPRQHPPPLNMSDDLGDMTVINCGTMRVADSGFGVLTLLTPVGHYDFVVDDDLANGIVQALRELLRGDSKDIIED